MEQFSGTKRRKVLRSDTFYYVSLLDTLKLLLTNKEIQNEVTSPHHSSTKLEDFCDGSLFKTHPLFSWDPLALQIIGYYDELEVVNPIGSYVKKHKLGCLFFTLANIRPQFCSTLKGIFVVCVGRYEDISSYGLDAFLEPFVDLKTLLMVLLLRLVEKYAPFMEVYLHFWQITWQHMQLVVLSKVVHLL